MRSLTPQVLSLMSVWNGTQKASVISSFWGLSLADGACWKGGDGLQIAAPPLGIKRRGSVKHFSLSDGDLYVAYYWERPEVLSTLSGRVKQNSTKIKDGEECGRCAASSVRCRRLFWCSKPAKLFRASIKCSTKFAWCYTTCTFPALNKNTSKYQRALFGKPTSSV